MRTITPATEDDMITAILEAELHMQRHDYKYAKILKEELDSELPEGFFTRPEYAQTRQKILSVGRGWPDKLLFKDFPLCDWGLGVLERKDLSKLDYIRYDYWDALSVGTHRVTEGAATVAAGTIVYEQPNDAFWEVERLTKQGGRFPPLVLLKDRRTDRFTIVEGHTRATGFALADMVPKDQPVIIGTPRQDTNWSKEK